jgi:peptidoglycan hydrolase-like protein with peptidoglycan-binding domain
MPAQDENTLNAKARMSISTLQARLALAGFLAVATATAANMLFLQDPRVTSKSARAQAERVKARAEADRQRRLAIDDGGAARSSQSLSPSSPALSPAVAGSTQPPAHGTPRSRKDAAIPSGIGRFSPGSGTLERASAMVVAGEQAPIEVVKAIQAQLARRGYEPGAADGVIGLATRAAILAYEHDQGLPLTAEPSEGLLARLQGLPSERPASSRGMRPARAPHVEMLVRTAQQSLAQLGYFTGKIDGLVGDETVRAIREFEMDSGLVPTGRISAPLILRLARSTSSPRNAVR